MAAKQTETDSTDNLLYIHIDGYKGYNQDILTQKLSKLGNKLLICPECHGIAREAVFCEGKTICKLCTAGKPYEPNDDVRESVNELNVICPLNYRSCKWKGELRQMEQHILQCDHLLILCNLQCSTVLTQYDLTQHITHICPMRKLPCEFCEDSCLAKNVNEHLTKCPAYILDCPQGCMERVRRDNMNEHTEIHCEMKMEPCSYHEFGCKTNSIAKRDVQTHQQQHVVSHQECLYQQIKISNKDVSKLNIVTEEINEKVDQLEKVSKDLKQIVEMQKNEISTLKNENSRKINISLIIMKIHMGQEISPKEFEFIDIFKWEIADHDNFMKKDQNIGSPIFQLFEYNLQCQAQFSEMNYLIKLSRISIRIRCLMGKVSPQELHLCYFQVQLTNRNNENQSIGKKGKIDLVIKGDYIEIAVLDLFYHVYKTVFQNNTIILTIQLVPTYL